MSKFEQLVSIARKQDRLPKKLLCLDPGETTGWALFEEKRLADWGQISTVEKEVLLWPNLIQLFEETKPTFIVCEDYRIYQHKLARHSFSPVLTLRLIGGIDLLCNFGWFHNAGPHYIDEFGGYRDFFERCACPIHYQMATQAKTFVTDEKLRAWGYWQEGMRHSRDAIRHGCYFLFFYKRGQDIESEKML